MCIRDRVKLRIDHIVVVKFCLARLNTGCIKYPVYPFSFFRIRAFVDMPVQGEQRLFLFQEIINIHRAYIQILIQKLDVYKRQEYAYIQLS